MNSCCSVIPPSSLFSSVAKPLGRVTHTPLVSLSLSYYLANDALPTTLLSTQFTCSCHHSLLSMASSYPHYCHSTPIPNVGMVWDQPLDLFSFLAIPAPWVMTSYPQEFPYHQYTQVSMSNFSPELILPTCQLHTLSYTHCKTHTCSEPLNSPQCVPPKVFLLQSMAIPFLQLLKSKSLLILDFLSYPKINMLGNSFLALSSK